MSEFILDSGHHWMQTCDACDGAFHTGKRPKREEQTDAPDFVCAHCAQQVSEIERLKAELARFALSGQVAEDEATLAEAVHHLRWTGLRGALSRLAAKAQGYEAMKAERDALKADVQRFIEAAAHDQQTMDTIKQRHAETVEAHKGTQKALAETMRERDAAVADNAVLLDGFLRMMGVFESLALEAERSGDVVRAGEHRRAAESLRRIHAQPHLGAALLSEHAKALVRARNEGREQVALWAEALAAQGNNPSALAVAASARAMKEPES